jgi:hypothetical protein
MLTCWRGGGGGGGLGGGGGRGGAAGVSVSPAEGAEGVFVLRMTANENRFNPDFMVALNRALDHVEQCVRLLHHVCECVCACACARRGGPHEG